MSKTVTIANPFRLLLATFDLFNTVPGDLRYNLADSALGFHGPVFCPVKQLRFLITKSSCKAVKASLEQRIGRQATTFVTPITSIPAWRIHSAKKQMEWRRFVKMVEKYDVPIRYLSDYTENQ